jgi:hypothetical protein
MSEVLPSYLAGQLVRVIPGVRNNTPRRGAVRTFERHSKDECFDYSIRVCDKPLSKRYRIDDLVADSIDAAWLTETVVALATGIAADSAFDRLPILADALEEAGCDDEEILSHCRGHKPHECGCWVVDLVLKTS